jgi:catechol 2,3-dioxygenase-like lactoylglutathione lyase family enzyme
MTRAIFKRAVPYADDEMNLPVSNVDEAIPFYVNVMGFRITSQADSPIKSAVLERDQIKMGLAENGGDSTQEGCFFEVDDVEVAFAELSANGLGKRDPNYTIETYSGSSSYKVFFVIAPDGLCYCIGQPESK